MPKIITEDMIEQVSIATLHQYCYTEKPEMLPDGTERSNKKQVVLSQ